MNPSNELLQEAEEIATLLKQIRESEREKIVLQNKLEDLKHEQNDIKDKINKIDSHITSTKYAITNRVNESVKLTLVKNGS